MCSAVAGALAPGHALVDGAMVGVGVAEGGGGGGPGPGEPYPSYGEYYSDQYYVPDMCTHPQQHPQHAHVCTLPPEYGEISHDMPLAGNDDVRFWTATHRQSFISSLV